MEWWGYDPCARCGAFYLAWRGLQLCEPCRRHEEPDLLVSQVVVGVVAGIEAWNKATTSTMFPALREAAKR